MEIVATALDVAQGSLLVIARSLAQEELIVVSLDAIKVLG